MSKRIYMILAERDFPPDIRVEKEARALRDAGYEIIIICSRYDVFDKQKNWEGCKIIRKKKAMKLTEKTRTLIWLLTRYHGSWARLVTSTISKYGNGIIHVHDLPMLGTMIRVGKTLGIKVVSDLHENYAAMAEMWNSDANSAWYRKIINNAKHWKSEEKMWTEEADHVLVVIDEARDRLVMNGLSSSKITIVENTEDPTVFSIKKENKKRMAKYNGKFIILYVGGLDGSHRGIQTAIDAFQMVAPSIHNARLLIVGDGILKPLLQKQTQRSKFANYIEFLGKQPFDLIPTYISISTVCLVPHISNPLTETTIPHKLFQYMILGKPVIVSSCGPLKRIVEETGAGLVFKSGDIKSLALRIQQMTDERHRMQMGEAGKKAVYKKYNWKLTSRKLVRVYNELFSK